MTVFLPKLVKEFVDLVDEVVGVRPEVQLTIDGRWLVKTANDRVVAVNEFKLSPGGRTLGGGHNTLHIDGERYKVAESVEHFAMVFHADDPAAELQKRTPTPKPVPVTEEIEPADLHTAPPPVRKAHNQMVKDLPADVQVTVGMGNRFFWSVTVQFPDNRARLRLNFWHSTKKTKPSANHPIQLLVGENDMTDQVNGDIQRAIGLLGGAITTKAVEKLAISGPAGPTRMNAVEVRRRTVIRN